MIRSRPIGLRRPREGHIFCPFCGRTNLKQDNVRNEKRPFHFAPDPPVACGLPCEGGPISNDERRDYRETHSGPSHCFKRVDVS